MADKVAKGRQARGLRNGKAKLSDEQVLAIRSAEGSCPKIAAEFGVSRFTIWDIKNGRSRAA